MDGLMINRNAVLGAFVMGKSLGQVVALLLDGWLQALLPNSKVPECVKSESSLVFPNVAIRHHQTFKKGTKKHGVKKPSLPSSKTSTNNTTFVPRKCFKKWNGGTIHEVLSFFHQCLSHSFVAVQDHDSPTEKTKAKNVSVLSCKLEIKTLREGTNGPTAPPRSASNT